MDLLKRSLAPITNEAWEQIDEEARRVLELHLAGRKLVDFSGPHGWTLGCVNTGRLAHLEKGPIPGVSHAIRVVQPIVELRSPIVLPILELDYAARGAEDIDLDAVIETAEKVAHAEDTAIFHGFHDGKIEGIIPASPHAPLEVGAALEWPRVLTAAKEKLRLAGVNGPYALAAGLEAYDALVATGDDGYPLRKRIEETILDQPIVWAPALQGGAVLMSTRGGDYELTVGQDLSVGYASSDRDQVELYITETFTFRVLEDRAAIFIRFTAPPQAA
ncbi:MAG TPA: family 1 encapsulin nanocompartment shell protein [Kofleriaceae bacterium]|nr:family 1 encapsulin nanocompartment shell protein [Kofleriaceae bacterium]